MHPMFKQLLIDTDAEDLAAGTTGGAACTGPGEPMVSSLLSSCSLTGPH